MPGSPVAYAVFPESMSFYPLPSNLNAMNSFLDDPETYVALDPDGMLKAITGFPASARKAIANAEKIEVETAGTRYDSILVAGMGGSAVGGLLLRDWLNDTLKIPIEVSRGYHLPAWVDERTLIYSVSYSGNTEETLSQYREATSKGCTIICFSSGGKLEMNAKKHNHSLIHFPEGQQPRAAIPYQFYSLAAITRSIGLIDEKKWLEVDESIKVVEELCAEMNPDTPSAVNLAKQIASEIKGYVPFIYAPRLLESVAYRYSTQFNENSKSPAAAGFYPEAFHNSIMAREGAKEILERLCIVVIQDPKTDARLNQKIHASLELMKTRFSKIITVGTRGNSNLARIMSALIQGDYISAYLGLLYGVNPSTTDSIRALKAGTAH